MSAFTRSTDWHPVCQRLHEQVMAASYDSLASALARLHQPRPTGDIWPTCHGCDRDDRIGGDAVWPCRTYTVIATTMLRVPDIENLLVDAQAQMRRHG